MVDRLLSFGIIQARMGQQEDRLYWENIMEKKVSEEKYFVGSSSVFCDGGPDMFGHPGVYLDVRGTACTTCPYCSRQFFYEHDQTDQNIGGDSH